MVKEVSKKVYVAMSGGVDSSVTAALLKERGYEVVGVHIKMWSDPSIPCNFKEDRYDAMKVAEKLQIPFQTRDFTEEYRKSVVKYLIREYAAGRTPNPDVMCNRHVKFGVFLERALALGADFIATGHYVRAVSSTSYSLDTFVGSSGLLTHGRRDFPRTTRDQANRSSHGLKNTRSRPRVSLLMGKDENKDQSYFLWTLNQQQLQHCLFPIGEFTKPEVREMARKFGLPTAEKKDSQGICFIGEINLTEFLKKHIPVSRGKALTTSGKEVGEHEGLPFYTIGQREGLGIGGGGVPYYVAKKDFKTNTLVVAEGPYDEKLFTTEAVVTDVNWIGGVEPKFPLDCLVRVRYRQPLQECRAWRVERGHDVLHSTIHVQFEVPQRAVTPGQSIVFYRGDEMLGGGVIQ